jgi:hypothetical protein
MTTTVAVLPVEGRLTALAVMVLTEMTTVHAALPVVGMTTTTVGEATGRLRLRDAPLWMTILLLEVAMTTPTDPVTTLLSLMSTAGPRTIALLLPRYGKVATRGKDTRETGMSAGATGN